MKRHWDNAGEPLCGAKDRHAVIVEDLELVSCLPCKTALKSMNMQMYIETQIPESSLKTCNECAITFVVFMQTIVQRQRLVLVGRATYCPFCGGKR